MRKFILGAMAVVLLLVTSVHAETHPERVRLLIHGHRQMAEGIDLAWHYREIENHPGTEFFTRVHLFL